MDQVPETNSYAGFVRAPDASVPVEHGYWPWNGLRIHLERIRAHDAPVRLLLVHGAGGNASALRPYAQLFAGTADVLVPDLPGYGQTVAPDPAAVRYGHWQAVLADLLRAEDDGRPLVLVGASMGGLLAYDAAAATGLVAAVVATCLLDPREPAVRASLTWHPLLGWAAGPGLRILAGPLARLRVPLAWIADMRHIANDPGMVRAVLADPRGGGGRAPLGWMRSFLESVPSVEPEGFTTPLVLAHPAEDRWTPVEASLPFYERIGGPKRLVMLEGCGHFPLEEPGLGRLLEVIRSTIASLA